MPPLRPAPTCSVAAGAGDHVSRGALKLMAALEHFRFSALGVVALDVGASTGGFTQVLLERGAARVYAVDVGHGQLHARLAEDPRVVSLERCDARSLDRTRIPEPVGAIVADVSFISLTKALPAALALAAEPAWLVALIKPQFEAGRAAVGRGGIVRDAAARARAVALVQDWVAAQAGWQRGGRDPFADRRRLGQRGVSAGSGAWRVKLASSTSSAWARKAMASPRRPTAHASFPSRCRASACA